MLDREKFLAEPTFQKYLPHTFTGFIEQFALVLAGLVITLRPLIGGMERFQPYNHFMRGTIFLAVTSWLLWSIARGKLRISSRGILWGVIIMWLSMLPQFMTSADSYLSAETFLDWTSFLAFALMLTSFPEDGPGRKFLLRCFVATGFVVAVFGIITYLESVLVTSQMAYDQNLLKTYFGQAWKAARSRILGFDARGPFAISNSLAGYLCLIIPVQLAVFLQSLKKQNTPALSLNKSAIINFIVLIAEITCFVLTWSKGAYAALFVGLIVFIIFSIKILKRFQKLLLGIMTLVIVAGFLSFLFSKSLQESLGHSMWIRSAPAQ